MKKLFTAAFFGIMLLGTLWGLLEASMGNILHWIGLHPYTGVVMTSIGLGLMSLARKTYKVRWSGPIMGVIAAGCKALDFFVPGSNVIRPMVAILLTAIAFEAMMIVLEKVKETNLNKVLAGVITGYASIAAFAYVTAYVMQFHYWLNMGFTGILKYLGTHGWTFGIGGGFLVWAGLTGGAWMDKNAETFLQSRTFYTASSVLTAICLIATILI
ncbi:hypothetical protein GF367_01980 [Candidatus Woesearchaeota archaeon]|nr:hypothetical protein [Candidatus Woesearchaeota archaeon]